MNYSHTRWSLLGLALLLIGCTSLKTIPRGEQTPGRAYPRSLVYLKGGERYQFDRIQFFPDSVAGEVKVQVERHSAQAGVYYEDEARTVHLPRSNIDSVAVLQRDMGKTVLYGAGIAALAVGLRSVVGNGKAQGSTGVGGKGPSGDIP